MKLPVWLLIALILVGFASTSFLCRHDDGPTGAVLRWLGRILAHALAVEPPGGPGDKPGDHENQKPPYSFSCEGGGVWVPSDSIAPGDSIPIWVHIDPDTAVVVIGQDSIPIALDIEIDGPVYPYRVWIEGAFDGPSIEPAAGLSWEPLELFGATAGPGVAVGWSGDWIAPVGRVSRQWRTLHAGVEVGWRLQPGADELHVGISAGFVF